MRKRSSSSGYGNGITKAKRDRSKIRNLFQGFIKCKHCGGSMIVATGGNGSGNYMVCSHYHFSKKCKAGGIPILVIENVLTRFMVQAQQEYTEFLNSKAGGEFDGELVKRQAEISSIKNGIRRLIKLAAATDSENVAEELKELEKKQKEAVKAMEEARATVLKADAAPDEFNELMDLVLKRGEAPPRLAIREKFRSIVKRIDCDQTKNQFTVNWHSSRKPDTFNLTKKFVGPKPAEWSYSVNGGKVHTMEYIPKNGIEQACLMSGIMTGINLVKKAA
jgi:ssDNA-binding Zn-finger/Zn-ribbon topoisomerase 1